MHNTQEALKNKSQTPNKASALLGDEENSNMAQKDWVERLVGFRLIIKAPEGSHICWDIL
jgi:hypothetical protein